MNIKYNSSHDFAAFIHLATIRSDSLKKYLPFKKGWKRRTARGKACNLQKWRKKTNKPTQTPKKNIYSDQRYVLVIQFLWLLQLHGTIVVKYKIVCITQKCSKLTHNTLFNVCTVLCWAVKLNPPFPKGKKVRRLQLSCSILYARKMDKNLH